MCIRDRFYAARAVIVSGGVSANNELRRRFTIAIPALVDFQRWVKTDPKPVPSRSLSIAFPSFALSTDNAATVSYTHLFFRVSISVAN